MSDIKQEKLIKEQFISVSIKGIKKILLQMENCICNINKVGTGFFCKIPFNNNLLPVLITNNHIVNENDINNNKIIELIINKETKKLKIDKSRKRYTNPDKNINITIIEIKPNKDKIYNSLIFLIKLAKFLESTTSIAALFQLKLDLIQNSHLIYACYLCLKMFA